MKLKIINSDSAYDVILAKQFQSLPTGLYDGLKIVLITDEHIAKIYQKKWRQWFQFQFEVLLIPSGEEFKTRETKAKLEDELFTLGCGRDTLLIAFGGGVVLDLVGFLAANYCRGIPVVYMPTSLLAMVDASIGGKTAVNTCFGKNLIGAFSNPLAVSINIDLLSTLDQAEFINGMAEVIKHAFSANSNFLDWLSEHRPQILALDLDVLAEMIFESIRIKKQVIEADTYEQNQRQILNFGHTIAHALEKLTQYSCRHGEAVAVGMVFEAYMAYLMGKLSYQEVLRIKIILEYVGLPTSFKYLTDSVIDFEKFLYYLNFDKKNKQNQVYILKKKLTVFQSLKKISF